MRSLCLFAALGLASASCFPSFDVKGSGGSGGSGAGTGQTSTSGITASTATGPGSTSTTSTGSGGGGGSVPCNLDALGPLSVGDFAVTDHVEITGLVAAGGNVFIAGHATSGFDGSAGNAGTFLFWGPEAGSSLSVMQIDPETNPPPQVALGVSQRNGISYVEVARARPTHLSLYEIEAASFGPTSLSVSAGFAADCMGAGQGTFNPSISTADDGSVVLAFERSPGANLPFNCDFGATYGVPPQPGVNDFAVLLGVHGAFSTPFIEVATPGGYQIEPRVATTSAPGAPFVLTTRTGSSPAMLQHSFATFAWDATPAPTTAGFAAPGTTFRAAAVGGQGFVGGTVLNATRDSLVRSATGGAPLLEAHGSAADARSVVDLHGGGGRLAVAGLTTRMANASDSGLMLGGNVGNRVECPASSVCSYAVSLDVSANPPMVDKRVFIEPTTSDVPAVAAVFSDSCGQTYAAGTFKAEATITTTGLGAPLMPTGTTSVFLVKLGN